MSKLQRRSSVNIAHAVFLTERYILQLFFWKRYSYGEVHIAVIITEWYILQLFLRRGTYCSYSYGVVHIAVILTERYICDVHIAVVYGTKHCDDMRDMYFGAVKCGGY